MLILLGTQGCHLCDTAEALLTQAGGARYFAWEYRDIALNSEWVEQYGERIPVLQSANGQEISWPFSLLDVLHLAQVSEAWVGEGFRG